MDLWGGGGYHTLHQHQLIGTAGTDGLLCHLLPHWDELDGKGMREDNLGPTSGPLSATYTYIYTDSDAGGQGHDKQL